MSYPYGTCEEVGHLTYYENDTRYTRDKCKVDCATKYIHNECGCMAYYMPGGFLFSMLLNYILNGSRHSPSSRTITKWHCALCCNLLAFEQKVLQNIKNLWQRFVLKYSTPNKLCQNKTKVTWNRLSFSFIFQVMDPFVPLTNIITATLRILVIIVYVRGTLGSYYFQSETTDQAKQTFCALVFATYVNSPKSTRI